MGRPKKERMVSPFGLVPLVPVTHFQKEPYGKEIYENAWHLVGPTIAKNHKAGLQKLLCIAFIEGMRMATFAADKVPPTKAEG